jgi:two-component system cell cycle sensor histidine kinase/response regulator CckA
LSVERATLLVVDDEGMVRALVRRMLEPEVCGVVEAEDGEAALRLIERGQSAIDVVLTDLVMPGIDGFDIITVLARHCPGLPVICMSGFASVAASRLTVPFIPKPFSLESLRAGVEPMLARSRELGQTALDGRPRAGAMDLVAAALELRRQRAEPPETR